MAALILPNIRPELAMYQWRIDFYDPLYTNPVQSRTFHELSMRRETMPLLVQDFIACGLENVVLWEMAPDATEWQQINTEAPHAM